MDLELTENSIQRAEGAPVPEKVDLRQITAWIIQGHSSADIFEALERDYRGTQKPVIVEMVKRLITQAQKRLGEQGAEADEDLVRGFAIEATRLVYQQALAAGDRQTALKAIRQMMDLASQ